LGNPGPHYAQTRHNVGFLTVDLLAGRLGVKLKRPLWRNFLFGIGQVGEATLYLAKPLTYMNRSGAIFPGLWSRVEENLARLLVICDTLDLPAGQCRLRRRGASAGHKGLASIVASLGREDFMRLVIGIGRPQAGGPEAVVDHVLQPPRGGEIELIGRGIATAADGVVRLLTEEPEKVMNALNQRSE
jgi:PTH1 family peptidyl-tRNA hydrolase